jgi:hypothetical protein
VRAQTRTMIISFALVVRHVRPPNLLVWMVVEEKNQEETKKLEEKNQEETKKLEEKNQEETKKLEELDNLLKNIFYNLPKSINFHHQYI